MSTISVFLGLLLSWIAVTLGAEPAQQTAGVAPAAADRPAARVPLNRLEGLVVSKQDGRPLADVSVAMAHAERAWIYFGEGDGLGTYGPEEKVLFFFTKRNGRTACEARTDGQGRFALEGFTTPDQPYTVAVAHEKHGADFVTGVVPKDYADKPLRIELDQPAYIRTERPERSPEAKRWEYVNLSLVPESKPAGSPSTGTAEDEAGEERAPAVNVYFWNSGGYGLDDSGEQSEKARWGPLPPGHTYRLTRQVYGQWAYAPTLYQRDVKVAPGQTVDVALKPEGGIKLRGRVTGLDGQPLPHVNVMVKVGADGAVVVGTVSDEQGAYEVSGVPPGRHTIELLRHARRTAPG